jgi:hypothetical protein
MAAYSTAAMPTLHMMVAHTSWSATTTKELQQWLVPAATSAIVTNVTSYKKALAHPTLLQARTIMRIKFIESAASMPLPRLCSHP